MPETLTPQELASRIRQKHPGAYDNVPDMELTQRVLAKYPEYRDRVQMQAPPAPEPEKPWYEKTWEAAKSGATTDKIPWSPLYLGAEMGKRFGNKAQALADEQVKQGNPVRAAIMESVADANKTVGDLLGFANSPVGMAMTAAPAAGTIGRAAAGAAGIGMSAPQIGPQQQGESTPDYVRRNLTGAAGLTGSVAAVGETVPRAKGAVRDAYYNARTRNAVKTVPSLGKMPPKAVIGLENIFRASAPTGMNKQFRGNVITAAGDLAEIGEKLNMTEARGGIINPDMRVRATVDAIRDHLKEMYDVERAPQIQRNANQTVNVSTNANSSRGLEYLASTAGDVADAKLAQKALDGGILTVSEADRLAMVANQELKAFEKMTPEGKIQAKLTNAKVGGLKALDTELKRNLNDVLRRNGEPGLDAYESRFSALSSVRDQLESRMNAVELERNPVGKVVSPLVKVFTNGKSGIASASQAAVADVNIGKMLESGFKRLASSGLKADRGIGRPRLVPPRGGGNGGNGLPRSEALKDLHETYGVTESHIQQLVEQSGLKYNGLMDTSVSHNGIQVFVTDPQTGATHTIRVDAILNPERFGKAIEQKRFEFKNPKIQQPLPFRSASAAR